MVKKKEFLIPLVAALCVGCGHNEKVSQPDEIISAIDTTLLFDRNAGKDCTLLFDGVAFTRALNNADQFASQDGHEKSLRFKADAGQDYFCGSDEKDTRATAPILLRQVENTRPFTLTARVTPRFSREGAGSAGALYIYANPRFWQKLAFGQDEEGNHRVMSMRTVGKSDDCYHDIVHQQAVYLRVHSDTRNVALYYSSNKREWNLVRIYPNNFPKQVYVGLGNQCPSDTTSYCDFDDLTLNSETFSDLRKGK